MEGYLLEWLAMVFRWLHVITAIAWIGASFYFVWLDNSLSSPQDKELKEKGVDGELWAVHGGGFYNPQKYMVAPKQLPENLHWFYWESYATWISGFILFSLVYLSQPEAYLMKDINATSANTTRLYALACIFGFYIFYDLICRLVGFRDRMLGGLVSTGVILLTVLSCWLFQGRGAFLIVGAAMATIMTANVLFCIIPGQRKVVATMKAGGVPDPIYGKRGKQRSVHNTYFTIPVVFCMLSSHFSLISVHDKNWLLLLLMMAAGVLIRMFFLYRHKGLIYPALPISGLLIMIGVSVYLMPALPKSTGTAKVDNAEIFKLIERRCTGCHSSKPTLMPGAPPPKGIVFENEQDLIRHAQQIYMQTVIKKAMPIGNITKITDEERKLIDRWYKGKKEN